MKNPNENLRNALKTKKKSKYGNKKTMYNGILYDSIREADYAKILDIMLKKGIVTDVKRQVVFKYEVKYSFEKKFFIKAGKYICDFVVTYKTGKIEVVDVKGYKTAKYKRDKKIMKKLFNIDIVEK